MTITNVINFINQKRVQFINWFSLKSKKFKTISVTSVALVFLLLIYFIPIITERVVEYRHEYTEIYTLVNSSVSKGAMIRINLPEGMAKLNSENKIKFTPSIKGSWTVIPDEKVIAFKPSSELTIGQRYTASLTTETGVLSKDFVVADNPVVLAILPNANTETDENTRITITFNRPMVPLTTLDTLESKEIPISIFPATEGKWKWISTRVLQFIPTTHLVRSTHYVVRVADGLASMDGMVVPSFSHEFTTRPLRIQDENGIQRTGYFNQPFQIHFNLPVDLEKTASEISVAQMNTNTAVDIDVEYGTIKTIDGNGAEVKKQDKKTLNVFLKKDRFGRPHLWDFDTAYSLMFSKAYPLGGGNIIYNQNTQISLQVGGLIEEILATASSSPLVSQNLFDPSGKAVIHFLEDIDLDSSKISGKGITGIVYGEQCKKENGANSYSAGCEKIPNKKELVISFDASVFEKGERIPITFKKIVNVDGLTLNPEPYIFTYVVYPELVINSISTKNSLKEKDGSVSLITICSNSPLKPKTGKDFYNSFVTSSYIVLGTWYDSYLETSIEGLCGVGQYTSRIHYGIHPDEDYKIEISATDVFGQNSSKSISFHTEKAPNLYLRFQGLQKIYNVTTPDKTKLTFSTENFDHVDMNICKVNPVMMLRYMQKQIDRNIPGSSLDCVKSVTDTIDLPKNLWVNNFFQIDLKNYVDNPLGQYIISFSNPKYVNENGSQIYERSFLSVTNLAVGEKKVKWTKYDTLEDHTLAALVGGDHGNLYWVSDAHTLAPVADASVSVYVDPGQYDSPQVSFDSKGQTDGAGIARFPLIKDVTGAVITAGDDTAIISSWSDTLNYSSALQSDALVYMYTDRPIYRPGQEVHIKGIYRVGTDGMFTIVQNKPVQIVIQNSKGVEVFNKKVDVSNFGTFNTDFTIPSDAPLGSYYINTPNLNQSSSFNVEEYVGAAFEAKAETAKDEYIAGDTVDIGVMAKYYFGVPVSGAKLNYSITAQNYYFDKYTDEYFNFGADWYNCYDCGYGDTYVKSGQLTIGDAGTINVPIKLDYNSLFKEKDRDQSKVIVFHGNIVDSEGKTVGFQKSFIVHRGSFYVGVKAEPYFTPSKESFSIKAKTVDIEGKSKRVTGLNLVLSKVEWKSYKRQEVDGGFYNRPERVLTEVLNKKIATDWSGNYSLSTSINDPGEYEISISGSDESGNIITSKSYVYVYGEGVVGIKETNNATLDVRAEKKDVQVGDTAKIIIQSPYKSAKALITVDRGSVMSYEIVDIKQNIYEYSVPIKDSYIPNVYVTVLLLSPDPQVKFGQVELLVNNKEKQLSIDTVTDKTNYLPGEKVSLTITTKDSSGKGVPAEVSVAVADMSVLALVGNPHKDPVQFFYGELPLSVTTSANIKNILEEVEIPKGTKGGDGGFAADLATKKRGEFKDTAFWQADVTTNKDGVAHVTFVLPDNLTRWQIESLGVTENTRTGVSYKELVSRKDVMLVPIKPRFIAPGDTAYIGAKIFNQTNDNQTLNVSYESKTLPSEDSTEMKVKVKAGETTTVYFKTTSPSILLDGNHQFTLSANNDSYNDTVEQTLPIRQNVTAESVAVGGLTTENNLQEYVYIPKEVINDRGGMKVQVSATLASYLKDAVQYLVNFPYGCSEQIASVLSGIANVHKALGDKVIADSLNIKPVEWQGSTYTVDEIASIGLKKVYAAQDISGGFAYYQNMKPDFYLTLRVLETLEDMKDAGYEVKVNVINSAGQYVQSWLSNPDQQDSWYKNSPDTLTAGLYALSRAGISSATLTSKLRSQLSNSYLNEQASNLTLEYLALLDLREGYGVGEKVFKILENRLSIDSRGAYLPLNQHAISWQYYETVLKDTAMLLKVETMANRKTNYEDKILRRLLAGRGTDGYGRTTNSTATLVDALVTYMIKHKETSSSFNVDLMLDSKKLNSWSFGPKNILAIEDMFIPISDFIRNRTQTIGFSRTNASGSNLYYDMGLTYYLPADKIASRDEGFAISRGLYALNDKNMETPVTTAHVGDVLHGRVNIITGEDRHQFSLEDYIPAGFELVNFNFKTEDKGSYGNVTAVPRRSFLANLFSSKVVDEDEMSTPPVYETIYPDFNELRDDRLFIFKEYLNKGQYQYDYYIRATIPGTFVHPPAVAKEMYFPENFGRTAGEYITVEK